MQALALANRDLEAGVASWELRKLERELLQLQGNLADAAREKVQYLWNCGWMWVKPLKNMLSGAVKCLTKATNNWGIAQFELRERVEELKELHDELSYRHQETLAERDELRDLLEHLRPEMLHDLVSLGSKVTWRVLVCRLAVFVNTLLVCSMG